MEKIKNGQEVKEKSQKPGGCKERRRVERKKFLGKGKHRERGREIKKKEKKKIRKEY